MTQFSLDTEAEAADAIADADGMIQARIKGLEVEAREERAKQSARQEETNELNDKIQAATVRLAAARRQEADTGQPYQSESTEIDPATGGELLSKKPTGYVAKLERELKTLVATRRDLLEKKGHPIYLEQVKEDLGSGAPHPLTPAEPLDWKPKEGEAINPAYSREFVALSAMLNKGEKTWNAPRTVPEMEATALAEIDRTADRGTPGFDGLGRGHSHNHRGRQVATTPEIAWPRERIGLDGTEAFDAPALVAWLFRDQLKAAVRKHIKATYTNDGAISAADKPALLADIANQIWHQRRVVEAAYLYARANGIKNLNRPRGTPTEIVLDVLPWTKGISVAAMNDAPPMDDAALEAADDIESTEDEGDDQ
jgi:hypothetical protein